MSTDDQDDEFIEVELPVRLRRTELAKLNRAAMRLAAPSTSTMPKGSDHSLVLARDRAELILRINRSRASIIAPDLFSDPSWMIMLDLFVRGADGEHTSVTSACTGSDAPSTTGLRHLAILVDRGLVEREAAGTDGRTTHVSLTNRGYEAVIKTLS